MGEIFPHWLTKPMLNGVKGFNVDAYVMALEGWRRGLNLRWYYDAGDVTDLKMIGFNPLGKTFSLSSEETTHYFYRSRGDNVANEAVDIVTNKDDTKFYLNKMDVPTPASKRYTKDKTNEEIIQDASSIGYPCVIKPTFGSLGKGVKVNIQTNDSFDRCLHDVRTELGYGDIVVERLVEGEDARIYVLDDKVLAATKRIPANITGDGENTIETLIEVKNNERKDNPYLSSKLIDIDNDLKSFLEKQGKSPTYVPSEGSIVYLRDQSNIALGGDPVDFTDDLPSETKKIAIQAVKSIPGLTHAGVDVLLNGQDTQVIEINGTADVGMHIFPIKGKPRNVPAGIIDFYFPGTMGQVNEQSLIYFNYKAIRQLFLNRDVQELSIPDAPQGKLYAKRFVISGKVQKVGYRNWIRKQALKQGLHGYTRNLKSGKVVVVVGSTDKVKVSDFEDVCSEGPSRANVTDVADYEWLNQVRIGFEVRRK